MSEGARADREPGDRGRAAREPLPPAPGPTSGERVTRVVVAISSLLAATMSASLSAPLPATLALSVIAAAVITWASGILEPLADAIDGPREGAGGGASDGQDAWSVDGPVAAALEAFGTATLVASPAGVVVMANARAQDDLSPKRPIAGRALDELFTKAEILDLIASARRGVSRGAHVRVPTADGTAVLDVVASALPRPHTPYSAAELEATEGGAALEPRHAVVVSVRDITELSLALQLKTDFVANASHELRTPISAIRAAVDTLGVAGEDGAMRERLLNMIDRHTMRLDELVRDMLDLSKLESPDAPVRIAEVRVSEIAQELEEGLSRACERKGVSLAFDLPPVFDRMRTDRRILMLILKNLVENAVKFAGDGTTVRIEGEALPAGGEAEKENADREAMGGARLRVIDRGEGIPLKQQQRIFERFFQNDESRSGDAPSRGTGLGLAIVKHGVRALSGTVSVDSVWKKGTTMTVDLPRCLPGESEPAETLDTALEADDGRG